MIANGGKAPKSNAEVSKMNEELSYAEMLEIPVETVTLKKKERKKKQGGDLQERLVEQVNDRMEERDPLYAESRTIERDAPVRTGKKEKLAHRLLLGEFVLVIALCAAIFLTNLLLPASAINTFVRGLFRGESTAADNRTYADFTLSPVVSDTAEVELAVSETGVLTFTAACAVYPPCEGKVVSVNGTAESGYTVELAHSDSFSTIISGLDNVYYGVGERARANLPLGHTDGEGAVRVMFYSEGSLLTCFTVDNNTLAWS